MRLPNVANRLVDRGAPPQVVCLKGERRCTAYKVRPELGPWLFAARASGAVCCTASLASWVGPDLSGVTCGTVDGLPQGLTPVLIRSFTN